MVMARAIASGDRLACGYYRVSLHGEDLGDWSGLQQEFYRGRLLLGLAAAVRSGWGWGVFWGEGWTVGFSWENKADGTFRALSNSLTPFQFVCLSQVILRRSAPSRK
ncbi:hypothetical protein [Nostoc sp. PCC 9305]|uniref:hypothetical protein n=1 Tax=Nostoc sp. PCC 9305 TaxID=296636 RepID=UPI0039C751F3